MAILLFPPRCPLCDRVVDVRFPGICGSCRSMQESLGLLVKEPACKKCGKPLEDSTEEYCADCRKKPHSFRQGRAAWVYRGPCKSALYRFKYGNRRCYAPVLAQELWKSCGGWVKRKAPDVIVPVPLHRKKQRERGYNQAALLSGELSRLCGIPVREGLLYRKVYTRPLKELSEGQRHRELKHAFRVHTRGGIPERVLLVDDIYTTGSTADVCAFALREAGVEEVYVLCMCIGR